MSDVKTASQLLGEDGKHPELDSVLMEQDKLVIKPDAAENKTAGGIFIPDSATEKPLRGTVLAHGKGMDGKGTRAFVGARIIFGKYAGSDIVLDGNTYQLVRESDVHAYLPELKKEE